MQIRLITSIILLLGFLGSFGQGFVIKDVLVSSEYAKICDIEIDPFQYRVCWQSPDDDKLWICHLDTTTWALTVPTGMEILIDSTLTPIDATSNSAEWGYDLNGTYLVYNKVVARKRYIAIGTEVMGTWHTTPLLDAPHRMNPHLTQNPQDSVAAFHYVSTLFAKFTKYKYVNNLGYERWIVDFKDANWAKNEQLLTGILPYTKQVALCDPATPLIIHQLTNDMGKQYTRPYMWRAPEFNNARMFFAVANGEEIRIFKESSEGSNIYHLFTSFTSPSSNPVYKIFASAEPVVYEGHSYITFVASSSECETACFPGEVWIASVDTIQPLFRMISNPSIAIRTDPESLATPDSLLVYYTEVDDTIAPATTYRIRKCDTGIGREIGTGHHGLPYTPDLKKVYPNPFVNKIHVSPVTGLELYTLVNSLGVVVWKGRHIGTVDFSHLPGGLYLLRIGSPAGMQSIVLIKQ